MDSIQECNKWYALFVMTGREDKVKERLEYRFKDKNLRVVVPKRKLRERKDGNWKDNIRTLFPGYILLNGYLGLEEYYSLKTVPGLIRILKDNNGPYIIDDGEIRVISRLVSNNEIIEPSNILISKGKAVVIDGPLLGMEGLIEKIDKRKGRVKLRLNFVGELRLVELAISIVQQV